MRNINIFLRQCLTETTSPEVKNLIQEFMDVLAKVVTETDKTHSYTFRFLPGSNALIAKGNDDFRGYFTCETGKEFNSGNFQRWRDKALREADVFVSIRTAMSESTAFELGQFSERNPSDWSKKSFIFCLNIPGAELKTTLLKEATIIDVDVISAIDPNTQQTTYQLDEVKLRDTIKEKFLPAVLQQRLLSQQNSTVAFFPALKKSRDQSNQNNIRTFPAARL